MTGRTTLLAWATTRLVVLVALFTYATPVVGDVNYFRNSLQGLARTGLAHTLVEYPLPAVGVVAVPWLLVQVVGPAAYGLVVVALALLLDGLFTVLLVRDPRRRGAAPVVAWILAGLAIGPLLVTRFDLVTGVLVAFAVLVLARRPAVAGAALAAATAIKLWPVLLIAPLVAAGRPRSRVLAPIALVGGFAVAVTLALTGWARLVSPLDYQWRRGLQIESVAATPSMLRWWVHPDGMHVFFARSLAWEVRGPGTGAMLAVTTLVAVLLLAFLALLWVRALARGRVLGPDALLWLVLAATVGFIVVGKVFSPQYLLWVAPVASAGLVVAESTRGVLVRWTGVLLGVLLLSQLVFPVLYRHLFGHDGLVGVAVLVLALRNVLTVWLFWVAVRTAWRTCRPAPAAAVPQTVSGAAG